MAQYRKFVAQILATIAAAFVVALTGDNVIDTSETFNIILIGLGSISVLGAGNLPTGVWAYTKLYISAATAGAVFLSSAITSGITLSEWIQLGMAVAGAFGVYSLNGPVVVESTNNTPPLG